MGGNRRSLVVLLALAVFALALPEGASAQDEVKPFGTLTCVPKEGYRICDGPDVPTFDGVPLKTRVALPASGDANLPLVVMLHGWGGQKAGDDAMARWATRGYATLSYTARGFNDSCGQPPDRLAGGPACAQGWVHLADARFEVRDTQYLAGLLADQGIVDPQRIGATGGSYGGGQSTALAVLKDRMMQLDGSLVPWTSPNGLPMRLAAAAPDIPWTDLVYSLLPNGRTLDFAITDEDDDLTPTGVKKESFVDGLYALGSTTGYYAPPGVDQRADLTAWYARVSSGEPYDGDPFVTQFKNEVANFHSNYYLDHSQEPAPIYISNGWTDDLFPVDEALRFYNRTRAEYPNAAIRMMFLDEGHQRGQNKEADIARRNANQEAFFERYLKGDAGASLPPPVEVLTQTCPKEAASGGPFSADTWEDIHPGEVRFEEPAAKSFTSGGSDPQDARVGDPIVAGQNPCGQTAAGDDPNTATYNLPPAEGAGFTLLGSPTVIADVKVTGANAQVASRLWDVGPDNKQTLVARGVYRPNADGRQVFQLHPGAWHFAAGHRAKLELLGQDAPYARASNGAFQIAVSKLDLRLPVRERPNPNSRPPIGQPAPLLLPSGAQLAPGVTRLRLRVGYTRARARTAAARSCSWRRARAKVRGTGIANVRHVTFRVGKRRVRRDARAPFKATLRPRHMKRAKSRRLRARVLLNDGGTRTYRRKLRRCS